VWPEIAWPGFTVVFQYWIADGGGAGGFSASNGLMGITP
jgi:hypothetical protein